MKSSPGRVVLAFYPSEEGPIDRVWKLLKRTTEVCIIRTGTTDVPPFCRRYARLRLEGETLVTGKAGTVVVMNAHMWHGGTDNRTARPRRAMHVYYTRGDKPQQQYQKRWVRPEVQARLTPLGRRLLALDDPRNDELSATGSGVSGFLK